nr:MAG TPA: hypothetical protein [Caudoviricetes sp.]
MYARMKTKIPHIIAIIILAACYISFSHLKSENKRLKANQETLLDSVKSFKVSDSLKAITVGNLELSLKLYKKYHADDAILIKQLKGQKPEVIIKPSVQTEYKVRTELKDSIIYKDTLKTILYKSKWNYISGFIDKDTINLNIINYDELLITESLQKKKFLFFRLPISIFGYKRKVLNVISKNPNTKIKSAEYITIK